MVGVLLGAVLGAGGTMLLVLLGGIAATRRRQAALPRSRETPDPGPAGTGNPARPGLRVEPADSSRLPRFDDVGGNDETKAELSATLGLLLSHPDQALAYRVSWNGILLHGPPGVGKSLLARAIAGEFHLGYLRVDTADLITGSAGAGPEKVRAVFATAMANLPCLVFFDEFDAVAGSRGDEPGEGSPRQVLAQLLQGLEECHAESRLVVVAATNDVGALDSAITRPGRFDRVIRLDLPDAPTREAIFRAALKGRPCGRIDMGACAELTKGQSPAGIVRAVDAAALAALRESIGSNKAVPIGTGHLVAAIHNRGGHDRPTVEDWNWQRLVLPPALLAELRQLQAVIEDPERSAGLGVDPPTGLLLTGPPGTGKTTIGKVLAAEASCSFYPVSGADITSRWVGESERAVARLFSRARDNAPSIVFIDEVDSVAGRRGHLGSYDRQLDQLLQEMDGLHGEGGVFVIGATNRPRALDPALLRAGRLSRVIEIPLPDVDARRELLELLTGRMPLSGVDLDDLALETEGFSGADLKGLCQQAALVSLSRQGHHRQTHVTATDFNQALTDEVATVNARLASERPASPTSGRGLSS